MPNHTHRATTTQARTHSGPGDTKLPGTVALKLNLRLGDLDVQTAYCDFNKDQPSLLLEIPLNHEQIFEAVVSARCLGLSRSSARTLLRRFFTFAGSVCTPPVKTFAFLYITGSTLRTCASTYCMVLLHTIHLLGLCTAQSSVGFRFHQVSGFLDNAALAESSCGFLDNAALAKSSRTTLLLRRAAAENHRSLQTLRLRGRGRVDCAFWYRKRIDQVPFLLPLPPFVPSYRALP